METTCCSCNYFPAHSVVFPRLSYSSDKTPVLGKSKSPAAQHLPWGPEVGWRITHNQAECSHLKANALLHFLVHLLPTAQGALPNLFLSPPTPLPSLSRWCCCLLREENRSSRTPHIPTMAPTCLWAAASRCTVFLLLPWMNRLHSSETRPFTGTLDSASSHLFKGDCSATSQPPTYPSFPLYQISLTG